MYKIYNFFSLDDIMRKRLKELFEMYKYFIYIFKNKVILYDIEM